VWLRKYLGPVPDFVIREWNLSPYPGDLAPLHVHHAGDEAFIVLCVMTPAINALIQRLHAPDVDDLAAVWAAHHSSLA